MSVIGDVQLHGHTVIEGGVIFRLGRADWTNNTPRLRVMGTVDCQTGPYRPAIFTAKDDSGVGTAIEGAGSLVASYESNGTANGYYGYQALSIETTNAVYLHDLRFAYCYTGLAVATNSARVWQEQTPWPRGEKPALNARERARPWEQAAIISRIIGELEKDGGVMRRETRAQILQAWVDHLGWRELPRAWAAVQTIQAGGGTDAGRELEVRLLQRWAEYDAVAAAEAAARLPSEERAEAYESVARVWARQTLVEPRAWGERIPEPKLREVVLATIAAESIESDPGTAVEIAAKLSSPAVRDDLIDGGVAVWAAADPEGALAEASGFPDGPIRDQALSSLALAWSDREPVTAVQFVLRSVSAGVRQENAVFGILQRWAVNDPASAALWAGQFPEGPIRQRALATVSRVEQRRELLAQSEGGSL